MFEADALISCRTVVVVNPLGLHLRPAERFVVMARGFESEIRVSREGRAVNGKSILDLATLAAECGSLLQVEARGPDAEAAVEALVRLASAGFQEDEPVQGGPGAFQETGARPGLSPQRP